MANKPGRLYRKITPHVTPAFFSMQVDGWKTFSDDEIVSITINRGFGEARGGVAVTTLEVTVKSAVHTARLTGREIRLFITSNKAEQFAQRTNYAGNSTDFMWRFRGRIGTQTIEDTGRDETTTTTITCASWAAAENYSDKTTTLTRPIFIDEAIQQLMTRNGTNYTVYRYGERDVLNDTYADTSYKQSIDMLTTDFEVLAGDLRNGDLRIMFLPWRVQNALDRIGTHAPLLRSQALAGTRWTQPNEAHAAQYAIRYKDSAGNLKTTTRYSETTIEPDAQVEEIDWEHFACSTDQWDYASKARIYRETTNQFDLPELRVDLLQLLSSSRSYDRRVAGELMTAETGDTINLSGDWPNLLDGVYVITGIREEIDADTWQLSFSLSTTTDALGFYSPDVPALVWDSAKNKWDEETRPWNH